MQLFLAAFLSANAALAAVPSARFTPGNWKLVDAGCDDPAYVLSPDEQAFVDAIRKGVTVDRYRFGSENGGTYETSQEYVPGARCIGVSGLQVEYLPDSQVKLAFGSMKWSAGPLPPGTSIQCGGQEQPVVEMYGYALKNDDHLIFSSPAPGACKTYHFDMIRER